MHPDPAQPHSHATSFVHRSESWIIVHRLTPPLVHQSSLQLGEAVGQALQFPDLAVDLRAATVDHRQQLARAVRAAVLETAPGEVSDLVEWHVEAAQGQHELDASQVVLPVLAVPILGPARRR